jgi:hypothetical protein
VIIGIDPGQAGYFVMLDSKPKFVPMPVKGETKEIDYIGVKNILINVIANGPAVRPIHVFLERAMPMAMGSKHAFNYGRGFAALEIAIQELQLPVTYVEPRKWTKELFQGIDANLKPKAQSLIAVQRLFPELIAAIPKTPKSGKLHEGAVDALLIAEYGRRKLGL